MKKAVESTNHDASNNEKPKKKTKDIKKKTSLKNLRLKKAKVKMLRKYVLCFTILHTFELLFVVFQQFALFFPKSQCAVRQKFYNILNNFTKNYRYNP